LLHIYRPAPVCAAAGGYCASSRARRPPSLRGQPLHQQRRRRPPFGPGARGAGV